MEPWTVLIQVATILLLLYFYIKHRWSYWSSRGVAHPVPPLLTLGIDFKRLSQGPEVYTLEAARRFGKVYGNYKLLSPVLIVNDAALIKRIMIQDFSLTMNKPHQGTWDPLWNLNLFMAESEAWKRLRSITSPTFTSGKLRTMQTSMNKCIGNLSETLKAQISSKEGAIVNVKKAIVGLTIEIISLTTFATETNVNSSSGKAGGNSRQGNAFVEHGLKLFQFAPLKMLSVFLMPRWWNWTLGIRSQFPPEHFDFFANLVKEIVAQRKMAQPASAAGRNRAPDFVQLLMDAYVTEGELKETKYEELGADMEREETPSTQPEKTSKTSVKNTLTDSEIAAQCIIFFTAGFETTSATITYLLYELAQNADIQERLVGELEQALEGLEVNSEKYYETVMSGCPYLDATIKETLRKYPPLVRLERRVGVDGYKLADIELAKDTAIIVSTYAVHHDPDYYPEPERFNPDRFLPENKHRLVSYTYLPFGTGPRNCIGMRFAYQEIKLLLSQLLRQFTFQPAPETPSRLSFKGSTLLLTSHPFTLKVCTRN